MQAVKEKYLAFLRGINVGGHHKVPMADLRMELAKLGFENIITILNSGNIIFESASDDLTDLENKMAEHLEKSFGFPIPTIVRKAEMILELLKQDPFKDFELTKDTRFYISFLKNEVESDLQFPWLSEDKSYQMLTKSNKNILSVLDLAISKTPKAMDILEKCFGTEITTRNWNTIKRIEKKLEINR